ncbi:MAG: hypothetical protein FWC96_01790 [Oscillospiraceae bacterium]|nr:hypothetical protein [Oscillospiraceae bacterium]
MPNYEKMYKIAFNALTNAERALAQAAKVIREAQQTCEETFLADGDSDVNP